MKKLISALIITLSFSVNAKIKPDEEYCMLKADLAGAIMSNRHTVNSKSDSLSIAGDNQEIQKMVRDAYRVKKEVLENNRIKSAVRFSNGVLIDCYKEIE